MTVKEFSDFLEREIMTEEDKENIFAPPLKPQIGLNILIEHFLGDDWCVTYSCSSKQVNTEAVCEILRRYPRKRKLIERLKGIWKRKQ